MVDQEDVFKDRRKHPRVTGSIPVKICGEEFDAVTETKNLSRSGAFCRISKHIDPMTKLKIQLLLSYKKNGKVITKKVACEGVVVRSEKISGEEWYNTAVYFNDISDKDASAIVEFVHCVSDKEEQKEG
jgi:hypothetical protein